LAKDRTRDPRIDGKGDDYAGQSVRHLVVGAAVVIGWNERVGKPAFDEREEDRARPRVQVANVEKQNR